MENDNETNEQNSQSAPNWENKVESFLARVSIRETLETCLDYSPAMMELASN